jgi:hypothetical protein
VFFIAYSLQPTVAVDTITGAATRRSIKRKPAGTTLPTLSCNCRLAGPVPLLCTLD